ncbi:TetR/AcrR family transcriptional regulator [Pseudomonas moraviensis subsp. stanleyae]|uniref:TetR/AcrR family transcriptional regulator n=1 Tax=Pseudomonas moraviensis TaxID=321662 RepID=UPI002E33C260|nr:TetR/AcrR family transcriptional regulator [Pseudomonas moraviensis]MED7666690.1 TetR/AcrR family transcriptional regulator [Pseudomonas moraviensis subsp. stanleyae]
MRPQKIPREELLARCAGVFKRYGYHGTTMDALAQACELTKASFYHHYRSKESLMNDVLSWTHQQISERLFSIAYREDLSGAERFRLMARHSKKLFIEGAIGCLMGVIAVDAAYSVKALMPQIREFMGEWAAALANIFSEQVPSSTALEHGERAVADYEGAILLSRIHNDSSYIDRVSERWLGVLV